MTTHDAIAVTSDELAESDRWFAAKFMGVQQDKAFPPHLIVLANQWGPIKQNVSGVGRKMNIAGREFARGLNCHAISRVWVRLGSPAKLFTAAVGVDSNAEWTIPAKGNVDFAILAAGKSLYHGPVMREGMAAVEISVPLGGAEDFILEITDGGKGLDCCQGNWADARVVMEDGRELWLGDMAYPGDYLKTPHETAWPFSFVYGGKNSRDLLAAWPLQRNQRKLDTVRTEHTLAWTDPATKLQVRCVAVQYHDFPVAEWTVHFKNTGAADTPILQDVRAIDMRLERNPSTEFLLHHAVGSPSSRSDYGPLETPLPRNASKRITTSGGRGSNSDWPYFNLQAGGEGTIIIVGWPGQWAAQFSRDDANSIAVAAGQETMRLTLHAGEEIRTPLMAVMFWRGDYVRSQNVWRRWMIAHNVPRPGGKLPQPMQLGYTGRMYEEMAKATEENQTMCFNRYLQEGLKLDYWWIDAGWYYHQGNWTTTGTWEVDRKRFPRGLRAISDLAHSHGMKMITWFEPERVTAGSWLANEHPEWLLGGRLLDLGNPEAWQWLVNHVDRVLTEEGIDLYRQDFNMEPLPFWQANDAPDRQGMTENKHICGYLAYWDELRRRHPNMLIDSCASGGRRNDLESMRRAVPLWRSDCVYNPTATQSQTYGLSMWIPFWGTGTVACGNVPYLGSGWTAVEPYAFWSNAAPSLVFTADIREALDYPLIRKLFAAMRQVRDCYYGDFHPLTPYTLEDNSWIGWQYNRPDAGDGFIQCFRRENSPYVSAMFKFAGLDPEAVYRLTDLTTETVVNKCGRELIDGGWLFTLDQASSASVLYYQKVE